MSMELVPPGQGEPVEQVLSPSERVAPDGVLGFQISRQPMRITSQEAFVYTSAVSSQPKK